MKKKVLFFFIILSFLFVLWKYRSSDYLPSNIHIVNNTGFIGGKSFVKEKIIGHANIKPKLPKVHKPDRPLAKIEEAVKGDYVDVSGAYIYNTLTGTTLSWVRKTEKKDYPGSVVVKDGKIAVKESKIIAGAFVFDMKTLHIIGGSDAPEIEEYLKSNKYLNIEKNAIASFVIQSVENSMMSGMLTIGNISKKITFPASILMSDNAVRINASFSLDKRKLSLSVNEGVEPFFDIHMERVLRK